MRENLYNKAHKAVSDRYREGWDRIYGANRQLPGQASGGAGGEVSRDPEEEGSEDN